MRLLPAACASAIERAHGALPDALHRAAFHLGSLAHEREPFPRLVFDLTLTVGTLTKLLLWRLCFLSVGARAWLAAASLSVAHDAVDVARVIFHESAYRYDLPWTREAFSRRQRFCRLCFSVSRLAVLLRVALDEATAMIATVDHFALGLGAGHAGAYTVRDHALGFLQTTLWTSLLLSLALERLGDFAALLLARRARPRSPASLAPRAYWNVLGLDMDGDPTSKFAENVAAAAALAARRFQTLPLTPTGSKSKSASSTATAVTCALVALAALVAATDASARRRRRA